MLSDSTSTVRYLRSFHICETASGSGLFSSTKAWTIWSCNSHAIMVIVTLLIKICAVSSMSAATNCTHSSSAPGSANSWCCHFSFSQSPALIAGFSLPEILLWKFCFNVLDFAVLLQICHRLHMLQVCLALQCLLTGGKDLLLFHGIGLPNFHPCLHWLQQSLWEWRIGSLSHPANLHVELQDHAALLHLPSTVSWGEIFVLPHQSSRRHLKSLTLLVPHCCFPNLYLHHGSLVCQLCLHVQLWHVVWPNASIALIPWLHKSPSLHVHASPNL